MTQPKHTHADLRQETNQTNTRREAISRLAQAIDNAREQGMTSFGVASALAVAMWQTHGIDVNGKGANVELDEPQVASGIDSMTDAFQQEVARG